MNTIAKTRGRDPIQDIRDSIPTYNAKVVFDVGANIGQSSLTYLKQFPNSTVYCFEPITETFLKLKRNVISSRVVFNQLALGESNSTGIMVLTGTPDTYHIINNHTNPRQEKTETVNITYIDHFCNTNKIEQINYLKIDTEGFDLHVLMGSRKMLGQQKIDFIEVETAMNPFNTFHASFESIKQFLENYKYYLFGIYEQVSERPTKEIHLRRCNPLFVSKRIIDANKTT